MRVYVTQKDIDEGEVGACGSCPVALAMGRLFPHLAPVVQQTRVHYRPRQGSHWLRDERGMPAPEEVREFVRRFDGGNDVEPFHFDLPTSLGRELA